MNIRRQWTVTLIIRQILLLSSLVMQLSPILKLRENKQEKDK